MFDLPSFRIGKVFGIPLEVNASWLLVFVLVATALSLDYFPRVNEGAPAIVNVMSGVVTALLFFVSVLLHEMSHSLVARAGGQHIRKITLFIFGGVAQMEQEPATPGKEFVMAIAGPGMSLALAVLCSAAWFLLAVAGAPGYIRAPVEYLAFINVSVAVFNMLPGFPLDGGRVLRAFLWRTTGDLLKATQWATSAGRGLGWLMVSGGLLLVLLGSLEGVWLALLGWFLSTMAANAYRDQVIRSKMSHVSVGSQMTSPPIMVPGDLTVQQLVDEYFLGGRHSRYPVVVEGRVVGILHLNAIQGLSRDRWATTRLTELLQGDVSDLLVDAEASIESILGKLGPEGAGAMLVVREGRLAGVITRSDVIRALRTSRSRGL